ncbi:hypothetical protein LTR27_001999 [Elasticomyces elasticus]|nr:hypothetical protein LTR27_001999 [Elasticomyces elasticus]
MTEKTGIVGWLEGASDSTYTKHAQRQSGGWRYRPKSMSARQTERKRERTLKHFANNSNVTALKQGEENEYGLAVGVDSVKSEGDGNVTISRDGSIIKAESYEKCAPSEVKQIDVEPGSYVRYGIAKQIKPEQVEAVKIKVEAGDD